MVKVGIAIDFRYCYSHFRTMPTLQIISRTRFILSTSAEASSTLLYQGYRRTTTKVPVSAQLNNLRACLTGRFTQP
jgi:hypothetical protein